MNKVIAVVGMCGSGKSVATDLFVSAGWVSVYFGGITLEAVKEKGLPITPDNERMVREELRSQFGQAAYAIKLLPSISSILEKSNVIVDGLYTWSEYKYLKDQLKDRLEVLCIISDREMRYKRLANRPIRPLSAQEAVVRDYAEIENLEKGGPIAAADTYIVNNGTKEEFTEQIEKYINKMMGVDHVEQ